MGTSHGYEALIVDYGGVLTSHLGEALDSWCQTDGLDRALLDQVIATLYRQENSLVHDLETGAIAPKDFEKQLASNLVAAGSVPLESVGLLQRMFAGFREDVAMTDAVLSARRHGLKTALLSNSWGNSYPRDTWGQLFDITVISGEVGMRKPNPDIFLHTAKLLGLEPEACIFVDDLAHNVRGSAAVGMTGIHHITAEQTRAEIEALLELSL